MLRLDTLSRSMGVCLLAAAVSLAHAQFQIPPGPTGLGPPPTSVEQIPQKTSLPVAFSIPLRPLGFSVPGNNYLLRKQSLLSLDFLGEDRLLFTFHVSGLMERGANDTEGEQQKIRAEVLSIADGKIQSQAEWAAPDRLRYLWMLNDGHFLLRFESGLEQGDAGLKLDPYLPTRGRLMWIQMDPRQQFLITNVLEPADAVKETGTAEDPAEKSDAPGPAGPQKTIDTDVLVVRTVKRSSGEVVHLSRVPWTSQTTDWPMNSEGYLERSKETNYQWLLTLKSFTEGSRELMHIRSQCPPQYSFVSDAELLVNRCDPESGWKLGLMTTDSKTLWEIKAANNAIWPKLVVAQNGSRVVRETMLLKHPLEKYKRMLGVRDFQGQVVRVFDVNSGKLVLESPLTPMFDGGGNVAISPSGKRVAILNAGAIQVYQLP
jgi:hypothetical protein